MSVTSRANTSFSSMESFSNDFHELDSWLSVFKDGKVPSLTLENTRLHAEIHLAITTETFEYISTLCDHLFTLYRDGKNRPFVLQFLPSFITVYHDFIHHNCSKQSEDRFQDVRSTLDTFFVGLYNLSVLDEPDGLKIYEFRIPNLTTPSIYHTPNADLYSPTPLTRRAVSKHENRTESIHLQAFTPFDVINATTREQILWFLLMQYGMSVSFMDGCSYQAYIQMSNKILGQGFHFNVIRQAEVNTSSSKSAPRRIHVSSRIMTEILGTLFYLKANSKAKEISDCMLLLKKRAEFELYPDVIMMTESMDFLHEFESQRAENQDTIGIEIELPPTVELVKQRRSATTARSMKIRQKTNRHLHNTERTITENDLLNETTETVNTVSKPSDKNLDSSKVDGSLERPPTLEKLTNNGSFSRTVSKNLGSENLINEKSGEGQRTNLKLDELSDILESKMSIESSRGRAISASPSPTSRREYKPVSLTSTQTYFQTLQQQRASSPNVHHVQTILQYDKNAPLSRGSSLKHKDRSNIMTTVRFVGTDENRTNSRETYL